MKEEIGSLIDSIAAGNAAESSAMFNAIMASKVQDRMIDYRQEVAATLFTAQTDTETAE